MQRQILDRGDEAAKASRPHYSASSGAFTRQNRAWAEPCVGRTVRFHMPFKERAHGVISSLSNVICTVFVRVGCCIMASTFECMHALKQDIEKT